MKRVRHLITVNDLTTQEVQRLFAAAKEIKKRPGAFHSRLRGKTIGLVFEKPSTRTWVSFEAGMAQLGGSSIYLGPEDISLGKREATKDVARVLSRYLDAIALRTFSHQRLEEFSKYATRPVINGLSDFSHPCQALADLYTIEEKFGTLRSAKISYVGDGNNVLTSLLLLCAKMGVSLSYAVPKGFEPGKRVISEVRRTVRRSGAQITHFSKPGEAVRGADIVYTDVWISMGQEKERAEKMGRFKGFQVNARLLKYAKPRACVMHCLPAHRGEEVTDKVLESKRSIVFDQAENRLHVQKAILLFLIDN